MWVVARRAGSCVLYGEVVVGGLPEAGGESAGGHAAVVDQVAGTVDRRHRVDLPVHRLVTVTGDRVAF